MKLFRDTIHDYIAIPKDYCKIFIDTPIFQRLRRIEQTSMRVLFPCAHHDRFAHSLGVFHLGTIAFEYIKNNTQKLLDIKESVWENYRHTFLTACLLHDCGHAPFSHTFEKYYDMPSKLDKILIESAKDDRFEDELSYHHSPNPHERLSGIILLKEFKSAIENIGGDPLLAVRMIIGCEYHNERTNEQWLANCLISILNSNAIDIDKLDYTARDSWASGANNTSVDIRRLLSSLCMIKDDDRFVLAYNKSSLSVISSVLNSRNLLHTWFLSHHKVKYNQYVLEKAVDGLCNIIGSDDKEKGINALFSVDSFFNPVNIGQFSFYLTCDDDIISLLKNHADKIPEAQEYLYRKHRLVPLWKTHSEYIYNFGKFSKKQIDGKSGVIRKKAEGVIKEYLKAKGIGDRQVVILDVDLKVTRILKNEIHICVENQPVCYMELMGKSNEDSTVDPSYFLLYVPSDCLAHKKELIGALKHIV